MKKFWMLLLVVVFIAGCGKQEAPQQAAVIDDAATAPAELPELEQNKLYMNNPLVQGEPDTTFEPVPSEMEELSREEQELLGPAED